MSRAGMRRPIFSGPAAHQSPLMLISLSPFFLRLASSRKRAIPPLPLSPVLLSPARLSPHLLVSVLRTPFNLPPPAIWISRAPFPFPPRSSPRKVKGPRRNAGGREYRFRECIRDFTILQGVERLNDIVTAREISGNIDKIKNR